MHSESHSENNSCLKEKAQEHGSAVEYSKMEKSELIAQLQEQLTKEKERYSELYDSAPVGYCTLSSNDWIILEANRTILTCLGFESSELLETRFSELVFHEDQDKFFQLNDHRPNELRLLRKDGTVFWAELRLDKLAKLGNESTNRLVLMDIDTRKQAETSLRNKTQLLDRTGELAKIGGWEMNLNTMKSVFTREFFRIAEIDSMVEPELDEGLNLLYSPEARATLLEAFYNAVENGVSYDLELPMVTAKGRSLWVRTQGFPDDSIGKPVRMYGTLQDITSQKNASTELMQTKNHLEALLNAIPDLLFDVDIDGKILDCRASRQELLVSRPSILIGKNFRDILPANAAEACAGAIAQAAESGWSSGKTYSLQLPTGKRWFELSVSTFSRSEHKDSRFIVLARDVTERTVAEEALHESELRWRFALEGNQEGVWDWDIRESTIYFSKFWKQMLGYQDHEIPHRLEEWSTRVHPDDLPRVMRCVHAHFEQKTEHYSDELRMRCKDGSWVWILCRGLVVSRDEQGEPIRMIGTHKDITESKRVEQQLIQARSEAESANRAKGEFLANMSHEIRTPLTSILGFADLLSNTQITNLSSESRSQAVDSIKNAGHHLLNVINDILDFSKIEAQKMTVEHVETPLTEILKEVHRLLKPLANDKRISLQFLFSLPFPDRVWSDPTRLRQILMNVVGNAIKFTESGSVVVTAYTTESNEKSGGTNEKSEIRVEIADTGPGIAPEHIDRLFVPFEQIDTSLTRTKGGSGLGLVLSRTLARMLGGELELRNSELGKGSCFRFTLPYDSPPPIATCSLAENSSLVSTAIPFVNFRTELTGRILLTEDGIEIQNLIAIVLRNAGAEVDIAENGIMALEMIEKRRRNGVPYQLLLTDIQMPLMDGYSLVKAIRRQKSPLAIIALTAHTSDGDKQECINVGCDDYVAKPIDFNELIAKCSHWLGQASRGSHSQAAL